MQEKHSKSLRCIAFWQGKPLLLPGLSGTDKSFYQFPYQFFTNFSAKSSNFHHPKMTPRKRKKRWKHTGFQRSA